MQTLFSRLAPFLIMGIMLVLLFVGIVLFSYLLIFGALVGLVLYAITWVKNKFSPPPKDMERPKRTGRTIDHDDL